MAADNIKETDVSRSGPSQSDPTKASLLLIIPAHNEEQRIAPVLKEYLQFLGANHQGRWLLLAVLNGCTDDTAKVVSQFSSHPNFQWIEFKDRIGKGGAIIQGFYLSADFELVGFVDADGATPPHAFYELVKKSKDYDCVIGSRWLPGAKIKVPQSQMRRFFSRAFHMIVETLFRLGIKDTQCGAKLIRRDALAKVLHLLIITDMAFDINLLYSLKRSGAKILETPTEWEDKIGSKVRLGRASIAWLLSLLRLRLIYSPLRPLLRFVRPLELWLYKKVLGSSPPLPIAPSTVQTTSHVSGFGLSNSCTQGQIHKKDTQKN